MKQLWITLAFCISLAGCATIPDQALPPDAVPTLVGTTLPTEVIGETPPTLPAETSLPPSEDKFTRDVIYLETVEIRWVKDPSSLVLLHITGQLPTPCHQLATSVCPSCAKNSPNLIQVNLHSLIEKGRTCRGPTTPFEQDIPLGVYLQGIYTVQLNGRHVETFNAAKLGQAEAFLEMVKGNVYIEGASLRLPLSKIGQPELTIQGYIPTPCHVFEADVSTPNAEDVIRVEAYSLIPVGQVCIEVLQDFTTDVPLGLLPMGTYSIWLNGDEVGEVVVP